MPNQSTALAEVTNFEQLVNRMAPASGSGVIAESSRRVYRQTYEQWKEFALSNGEPPLPITFAGVQAFLDAHPASRATQQRRLSALRTLAQTYFILTQDPKANAAYQSLKLLKLKHVQGADTGTRRRRRALSPKEATKLLQWAVDEMVKKGTRRAVRDYAIISTLLHTGLRRAELASLRWEDIDLVNGSVFVAHGKGDKERDSSIFSDTVLDALRLWRDEQPSGYQYVFTPLRKGDQFNGDKPLSGGDIWKVITRAGKEAGLGELSPHDLRRSLATELLSNGMPLAEVQQQLGHKNAETTLRYARPVSAAERRKGVSLRWG